jgi:GR25 family glycosyltransferase involved in LPS biosynthesis
MDQKIPASDKPNQNSEIPTSDKPNQNSLLENILYINLEHRQDRREHTEKEFEKLFSANPTGNIIRINATATKHGAVGCSLSHIRCLEYAKEKGWSHVFICEDDITFMNPALFLSKLSEFSNSDLDWDVLVIAGNTAPPFGESTSFCIRTFNVQSTTGYIVQQGYYDVLIANYREGVRHLMADPTNKREYAIDMYWKRLQQTGRWYTLIPLSVYQYASYSDVENRDVDYKHLMLDLEKRDFFRNIQKKANIPLQFI